ncbi:ATP-binding protein [Yinghuangia seranimata]|nr:ATP-binding protein [Yinghuangia seranimata]MDI2125252.1 ATP-binding protein [Yinghuangia seranimata]
MDSPRSGHVGRAYSADLDGTGDPSLTHLLGRIAVLEERVRNAVDARRGVDPRPDDPYRGLHLSADTVRGLLDRPIVSPRVVDAVRAGAPDAWAARAARNGAVLRLAELESEFRLAPLDVDLLLIALAPDVDRRFEQFYGYLNDDVTRRRATVGLALELAGMPPFAAPARGRFTAGSPLLRRGLLRVDDPERPFLGRALRVPDRVAAHLLGDDAPDPLLAGLLTPVPRDPVPADREAAHLGAALADGLGPAYLRQPPGGAGQAAAAHALAAAGRGTLTLDLTRLADAADPVAALAAAAREAALRGAGLVAAPVDALRETPRLIRELAALPGLVVMIGGGPWDPEWSPATPLLVDVAVPSERDRAARWRDALRRTVPAGAGTPDVAAVAAFTLTEQQVERAARTAYRQSVLADEPLDEAHLAFGARAQNSAGLERLARRIRPAVGWDDLVLPPPVLAQLHELAARARHRDRVLGDWAMRPGGGRGRGVMALFAGDSGTGKTMSVEVAAGALGLDLYTVDLSTVVSKYVGETEKNLERIFTEAAGVNAVLLFDEADAVFGKRSEVKDAHDRYANVESAYLLQRMESFDGVAVLATNLRANLDEAFTRRLDLVVDFPRPDAAQRRALWARCLGPALPRDPDLDLDFCAAAFELAGGDIRSAAVTAAYTAADAGRPVRMADLITAVAREYRKLGRLCLESEFGPYLALTR